MGFDNFWGQRDGIFELYWILNIGLLSIAGFALSTAEQAPCYFGFSLLAHALIGLDVLTVLMYLYVYLYDGITSKRWNKMRQFVLRFVVVSVRN